MESVQQVDEEEYEEKVKRPVVKVLCTCIQSLHICCIGVYLRTYMLRCSHAQAYDELNSGLHSKTAFGVLPRCLVLLPRRRQRLQMCQMASLWRSPQRSQQIQQWMVMCALMVLQRYLQLNANHIASHLALHAVTRPHCSHPVVHDTCSSIFLFGCTVQLRTFASLEISAFYRLMQKGCLCFCE